MPKKIFQTAFLKEQAGETNHLQSINFLIRLHRARDEPDDAWYFINIIRAYPSADPSLLVKAELEALLCRIQRGEKLDEVLLEYLNANSAALEGFSFFVGILWLINLKPRLVAREHFPFNKPFTLVQSPFLQQAQETAMEFISILDYAQNASESLQKRLERLGKGLDLARNNPDPEASLLFLAAALRNLYRNKQLQFASVFLSEYQAISTRLTDGRQADSLHLVSDIAKNLPLAMSKEMGETQSELFTGFVPRIVRTMINTSKIISGLNEIRGKSIGDLDHYLAKREDIRSLIREAFLVNQKEMAPLLHILYDFLATMNIIDYQQAVSDRSDSRHIPTAVADELWEDFTKKLDASSFHDRIQEISPEPIALTPRAVVYRARLNSGEDVVIKFRREKARRDFISYQKSTALIKPLLRFFFRKSPIERIGDIIWSKYIEEFDYKKELDVHRKLYELFKDDPYIGIPKIFTELCNENILISEFIEGENLSTIARCGSAKEREFVAKAYLRSFVSMSFKSQINLIDQKPENMIVANKRLYHIDFGATEQVTERMHQLKIIHLRSILENDAAGMYHADGDLGPLVKKKMDSSYYKEKIFPLHRGPFADNRVRPYFEKQKLNIFEFVASVGLDDRFELTQENYFSVYVFNQLPNNLDLMSIELNWHQELKFILVDLGIVEEGSHHSPQAS